MLLQLSIKNFAIIDECRIDFRNGLIALTGETGAGKSIVVDALSAALGGRTGADSVRAGSDRAEIEAVFSHEPDHGDINLILQDVGLEPGEVLILSREVLAGGRSICRVNGRAVPVSTLNSVGSLLVDVHGQSEHLSLLKPARQLDMLDHFGSHGQLRSSFSQSAGELIEARRHLAHLEATRRSAEQRIDLLRFQVNEIEEAGLEPAELIQLTEERTRLANAEKLTALATDALRFLDGDDIQPAAVDQLGSAVTAVGQLAAIDPSFDSTREIAEGIAFQAQDLSTSIRRYRDRVEFDPQRLDDIESRLDTINRLCRKYGDTVEDVLAALQHARTELEAVEHYDETLSAAESAVHQAQNKAAELALRLSRARHESALRFVADVRGRLKQLSLGPAEFTVDLERTAEAGGLEIEGESQPVRFTASGIDSIHFLVAFNAGEPLKVIERVASGGETARFMLAVKATLADADDVPTLIFDEIDTGVGGRGGAVVGAMLRELAASHQVVSITHLPQIAAQAGQHLKVLKEQGSDRTGVSVRQIEKSDRVNELAEMLAGSPPSAAAVKNAQELLREANSLAGNSGTARTVHSLRTVT